MDSPKIINSLIDKVIIVERAKQLWADDPE